MTPAAREGDRAPEEILGGLAGRPDAEHGGGLEGTAAVLCGQGIPSPGTANDVKRTTGVPRDLEQAYAIIGGGHTVAVAVGVANGRHVLNVASIGLPATVSAVLSDELKGRWGVPAYPIAAVRAALRQRPFTAML